MFPAAEPKDLQLKLTITLESHAAAMQHLLHGKLERYIDLGSEQFNFKPMVSISATVSIDFCQDD